jgi:hypothetical protein
VEQKWISKTRFAHFAICNFCSSMLIRNDYDVKDIGKMAQLPAEMTHLQIGTKGIFQNRPFEIIGRHRKVWQHGYWNEWYLLFDNDQDGWLAEAQGHIIISTFNANPKLEVNVNDINAGDEIRIGNDTYEIEDIRKAASFGAEGVLPSDIKKGEEIINIDMIGENKRFYSIEIGRKTFHFSGLYTNFDDLSFTNLRQISGW